MDTESTPKTLPRELVDEWIAQAKEWNQIARDHGVRLTINIGHERLPPTLAFVASDASGGMMPDMGEDHAWSYFASDTGAPVRNYHIDGCDVSTHDMRVASRVCSATNQKERA